VEKWTYDKLLRELWLALSKHGVAEWAMTGGDDATDLIPDPMIDCPMISGIPDESGLIERLVTEGIARKQPRPSITQGYQTWLVINRRKLSWVVRNLGLA
jgi:hypothetical protein